MSSLAKSARPSLKASSAASSPMIPLRRTGSLTSRSKVLSHPTLLRTRLDLTGLSSIPRTKR